jgi:hypothetical protein
LIADALGLLVVNACFLGAGMGIMTVAARAGGGPARALGLAYLVGVAAYGAVAQLLLVLGAPLTRWQVVLVCAVPAAGMVLGPRFGRPAPVPWRWVAAVAAILALLLADLWFQPLWVYDAWTFWTPKARALAALDGLDAAWFTQADLLNRDYPLLLPAVEAAGFRFTGYETRLLDVQSWLFVVAFAAAYVRLVVARAARPWAAWGVLITILIAPSLADQLASAEADVPLAAFFACAGLGGYLFLAEGGRAWLVLVGVLAAGAAATKIEGGMFVAALAVAALVVARGRAFPLALTAVAALMVAVIPWRLWLTAHDVPNQAGLGRVTDVGFLAHHAGRAPYAAAYLAGRFVDPRAWLLLVPLCVVATVAGRRAGAAAGAAFTIGVVALCLLALVLAYWTTPFELHGHLATSARRVITGPLLFWAAVAPLLADKGLTGRGYPLPP